MTKKPKSLKRIGKDIEKGFNKNITKPVLNPLMGGFKEMGSEMGKITNDYLLPTVVSTAIPLASTALGALGAEAGIPPEITSKVSQKVMENYIPKQYQSKNKYVHMFADAVNMGVSGADPNDMMRLQSDFTSALGDDLGLNKKPIKKPLPSKDAYNPDNPYQDLMLQLMGNYYPIDNPIEEEQPKDNPNDDNDARYSNAELGEGADSIKISNPPYQQREGSIDGLLGAGLKKRRSKKNIKKIEDIEIYTKTKPMYKKFSHAKNSSLDQLLEARQYNEEKEHKKALKSMINKQTKALEALGY